MLGGECDSGICTGIGKVLSVGERREDLDFEGLAMIVGNASPLLLHYKMRLSPLPCERPHD